MKHFQTRSLILQAYDELTEELWNWPGTPLPDYRKLVHERSKFESCGRSLIVPTTGHQVTHWCRRSVCPACGTYHGRKTARDFLDRYPMAVKDDFRMVTGVIGLSHDIDEAFKQFREARTALHKAIGYRRQAKGVDRVAWQSFGVAGSLEIDMFLAQDFKQLGTGKQEQYRSLGFNPAASATGPIWIATVHALAHVGGLGLEAVTKAFQAVAPVVHIESLKEKQTLLEAAEGIGGYATKVNFETVYAFARKSVWPIDPVKTYLIGTMHNSHGRKGFRFVVNPKKKSTEKKEVRYKEAMVTSIGYP